MAGHNMTLVDATELRKLKKSHRLLAAENEQLKKAVKQLENTQLNVKLSTRGKVAIVGHGVSSSGCTTC